MHRRKSRYGIVMGSGHGTISVSTGAIEGESNCRTLEELMDQLDPETFWRAHRSYVVNIQHIVWMEVISPT